MYRINKVRLFIVRLLKVRRINIIVLMWVTVYIFTSCNKSDYNQKNDWDKCGLKGNVSSLKERHYSAYMKFGKVLRTTDNFECYSNLEEEEPKYKKKEINEDFSRDIFFNKDGFISEKNQYVDSLFSHKFKYEYRDNEKYKYLKNEDGKNSNYYLLEIEKYNRDGQIVELDRFHRHPHDKILEYKKIYLYNNEGRIGCEVLFDPVFSPIFAECKQTSYVYLGAMLPPRIKIKDPEGDEIIEEYTDTSFNILTKRTYNDVFKSRAGDTSNLDNTVIASSDYTFDSSGNIITQKDRFMNINLYSFYEYEYDKRGNWVKRVKYNTDSAFAQKLEPQEIAEREIQYYSNGNFKNKFTYIFLGAFLVGVILMSIWYWKKKKN